VALVVVVMVVAVMPPQLSFFIFSLLQLMGGLAP